MTTAQILATDTSLTAQDLADFASFMEPAEQEQFWIEAQRNGR
jgi:hypothetical protein